VTRIAQVSGQSWGQAACTVRLVMRKRIIWQNQPLFAAVLCQAAPNDPQRTLDSFLPALAARIAIALVAGSAATTRRLEAWLLVAVVAMEYRARIIGGALNVVRAQNAGTRVEVIVPLRSLAAADGPLQAGFISSIASRARAE
jgi:hypothetical protein